ncbi:MAG: hypothetical protein DRQ49_13135 [Gammaproteobacteria bacterium]|nr:MAG: hypothetical protein DRQ49_13135 [Gammaproteobacteria bacterium]RKZ73338.1 MAG: hypothetical protein DRQ57_14690 [Gammaproteobacteria bacterium]
MNINKHQQRGMSGTTIMFLIVILIVVLIVFFKLFPLYMDNWKVVDALESISENDNVFLKTNRQIQSLFLKQLSNKDIELETLGLADDKSLKQQISIDRLSDEKLVEITLTYQRTKPLMGNVSFLVNFENLVQVP